MVLVSHEETAWQKVSTTNSADIASACRAPDTARETIARSSAERTVRSSSFASKVPAQRELLHLHG